MRRGRFSVGLRHVRPRGTRGTVPLPRARCAPAAQQGIGEFVVGEMASQPPVPPPLRAVRPGRSTPAGRTGSGAGSVGAFDHVCARTVPERGRVDRERETNLLMEDLGRLRAGAFLGAFPGAFPAAMDGTRSNMTATDLHSHTHCTVSNNGCTTDIWYGYSSGIPFLSHSTNQDSRSPGPKP